MSSGVVGAGPSRTPRRGKRRGSPWITVSFIVTLLLLLAGIMGFHALRKGSYGRIGRARFYAVIAAGVVILIPNLVFLPLGTSIEWLFPKALLGLLVGFALYGVATLQARMLPRWWGRSS
jgi:hypothetical protein